MLDEINNRFGSDLDHATSVEDKLERQTATKELEEKIVGEFSGEPESEGYADRRKAAGLAFAKAEKNTIRQRIAVQKKRPDGRATDEVRPISIEVDIAPRTHGSALFTRGQTQGLSVASLGTTREEMRLDDLGLKPKNFYGPHYTSPPFSVGEAGFMRGPKCRDIGHGALA